MNQAFTVKVGDKEVKLKTMAVTQEVRLESQKHYVKALTESMSNGYQLRVEIERMLQAKGLMDTAQDEKDQFNIRKSIKDKEIELRTAVKSGRKMTKEEGRALAISIKEDRLKLNEIGSGVSGYFNNTAETYASNEQIQYFVYSCTVLAENGERYWPSFEAFKADVENPVYSQAIRELLTSMTGLDKDYERKLYENSWLIRMGFMNEKLQFINDKGQIVDTDGRLIDDKGRYVNSDGKYVDVYGNLVNENGDLLVPDLWSGVPATTSDPVT